MAIIIENNSACNTNNILFSNVILFWSHGNLSYLKQFLSKPYVKNAKK